MADLNKKGIRIEKIAALCGGIWFALIIDACYTWFLPWIFRYFLGTPIILYATLLLRQNGDLVLSKQRQSLFFLFSCIFVFQLITSGNLIKVPFLCCPMLCLVLWPRSVLLRFYDYLKKYIVFYAVVSIFAECLVLSGIYTKIPHIILPPYDNVQENYGTINRFYGFFVIPEPPIGLTFYRAMGPLREGGHFSVFLGFIYFVEKAVYDKRNLWITIAGFLTLSPNFLFFLLVTEVYVAITRKHIFRAIGSALCILIVVIGAFWFSPGFIRDEIVRIVLERSLQENMENVASEGFFALLDGRTNDTGMLMWEQFSRRGDFLSKLFGWGTSEIEEGFVLSDFRYLILRFGYLGVFLFLLFSIKVAFLYKRAYYGFCVLLFALFVFLTRAWMFGQLYIWSMMFLAVNVKQSYVVKIVPDTINGDNYGGIDKK